MGMNYDLRAPDYSYMVIAELKDFYYHKFKIFKACKQKTIQLLHLLQYCLQQFQDGATAIYTTVQTIGDNNTDPKYKCLCDFPSRLHRQANQAYRNYNIIDGHINLIQQQPEHPINLEGFS